MATAAEPAEFDGDTRQQQLQPEPSGELSETLTLPYSDIFRDAVFPYQNVFRPINIGGRLEPKIGDMHARLRPEVHGAVGYHTPFEVGGPPANAEIKLGPLYLDLLSLSGSLLYSDNVHHSERNREDGLISSVVLDLLAYLQVTENLRLAFYVGFVWLPLKNQFGVAGILRDPIAGRLFYGTDYRLAQVSYDLRVGEWEIYLYDNFWGGTLFSEEASIFVGESTDHVEDRAGRYVLPQRGFPGNRVNEPIERLYDTTLRLQNTVGAAVRRMLPTETRLELGVQHTDYWNVEQDGFDLPHSRDLAYVTLSSERESLRFKPFATYRISRRDERPWNQEVRGGIRGPITENLHLLASVGYYIAGRSDYSRLVTHVRLRHTINPQTYHEFQYRRDITWPEEDLENTYLYRLYHVFGPYLSGEAFGSYSTFEDLNRNNTGTEEWRAGVRLTFDISDKAYLQVGGWYKEMQYDNPNLGHWQFWTARARVGYLLSNSLEAVFTYAYRDRDSTFPGNSYYENLFVLTLTYYFGERYRYLHPPNPLFGGR